MSGPRLNAASHIHDSSSSFLSCHHPVMKRPHEHRDLVAVVLQGEMARIEHVQLSVLQVALERTATFLGEDRVICAPYEERRRLILTKILVPAGILVNVGSIVVKEFELNSVILWPAQEEQVRVPVVRADLFGVARAFTVDPFHAVGCEEPSERRLGFRSTVFPKCRPK